MKKILIASLLLVSVLGLSFGAGKKDASGGDQSLASIKEKGKFVLGLDDAFPPMGFRNDKNEIVGFDVDLAREVTKRMGVDLVLQPIDWNAKEQELNTGKIDCIWNGFTITEERKVAMAMTKPYMKNAQVLVVQKASSFNTLADLAGKSVGHQAGSTAADAIEANAAFKSSLKGTVEFKDNLTALMDLEIGGVDAVAMDLIVANYSITQSGKPFRVLGEYLAPEDYGVGFRKGDLALRNEAQKHLEAMAKDGTLARISTAWFGSDISTIGK